VYNGSDYWMVTENAEIQFNERNNTFDIYSDSEDCRIANNTISKEIIKQIVTEKRRRIKLQDDLENLYEAMILFKSNIDSLQEKNIDVILEYVSLQHTNRFHNVVICLDKCLEKLYESKVSGIREQAVVKQIHSLQHLKKVLANRDRNTIPWLNDRYYINSDEASSINNEYADEQYTNPDQVKILETYYPQVLFSKNLFSGQKVETSYS